MDSDGDILKGTSGDDTLKGGVGSDLYYVENSTDTVIELAGEGDADRIAVKGVDCTLAAGVEIEWLTTNSSGSSASIDLRGNALAQTIVGNAGKNILHDGGTDGVGVGFSEPDKLVGLATIPTWSIMPVRWLSSAWTKVPIGCPRA